MLNDKNPMKDAMGYVEDLFSELSCEVAYMPDDLGSLAASKERCRLISLFSEMVKLTTATEAFFAVTENPDWQKFRYENLKFKKIAENNIKVLKLVELSSYREQEEILSKEKAGPNEWSEDQSNTKD